MWLSLIHTGGSGSLTGSSRKLVAHAKTLSSGILQRLICTVPVLTAPCVCLHTPYICLFLNTSRPVHVLTLPCAFPNTFLCKVHCAMCMSSHFPVHAITFPCPCPLTSLCLYSQFPVHVLTLPCAHPYTFLCMSSHFPVHALTLLCMSFYFPVHVLTIHCACPHISLPVHLTSLCLSSYFPDVGAWPHSSLCLSRTFPVSVLALLHMFLFLHFPVLALTLSYACPHTSLCMASQFPVPVLALPLCLSWTFFCLFSNFYDRPLHIRVYVLLRNSMCLS